MYSENLTRDLKLVARAVASNVIARVAPATYVRMTRQTGRGADQSAGEIAAYFVQSFEDYRQRLVGPAGDFAARLQGLRVLEYGPGDILGVALLFYAHGAAQVQCVDRFPLENASAKNLEVYRALLASLPAGARARGDAAFQTPGDPASGFRPECVGYRITPDGLAGEAAAFDLIVSRAVLEHVNSLDATLHDVGRGLRSGGLSLHSVDLRSHNLDRDVPLDFLTWPEWLYKMMYSHKGFPNRLRVADYRRAIAATGLELLSMEPSASAAPADVARVHPHLARHLRHADQVELGWLGFWMTLRQPGPPRQA
jgi:SAM-dependent methyltransferase